VFGDGAYVAAGSAFSLGSVATLALGVYLYREHSISLGSVLALFRFSQMIREPLERIAEQMREFQKASAGARRARRLLATPVGILDGAGTPLPDGPLSVDFDDVRFGYGNERTVLHHLDLHLEPGTVLGVVGRTGSGKTTIGRLLLRFWDTTEGTVRLGGIPITDTARADLHRRVGVVTQEVELLRASVRDNLTMLGTIDADDATLLQAIDDVGLTTWFRALPGGLDAPLHGDTDLSAGEAQLLAFARVFLADPGLVVLDEASSRLDPATEAHITAATDRLLAGRTVVIIAHRLATLDRADQILVLDHGTVVEHGERTALAADPASHFAHLLTAGSPDAVPVR
jgi:ATP-binding cassette subfamily B protein